MADQENIQQVSNFIDHLLNNPNIKNEPLMISEGLILNFIVQNQEQLKATFKSSQFFPHLDWKDVLQLIVSNLYERVIGTINPVMVEFLESTDFSILSKNSDSQQFPTQFHRERLNTFLKSLVKNKDVRYHLNSVINIFTYNIIEKYLNEIFNRRGYLYNELVRVQKTYLECDEYIVFLKSLLLIKNAVFMKIPINPKVEEKKYNINDCINSAANLKKFFDKLFMNLKGELPNLPEKLIRLALKSNVRESQTDVEDASSRFIYILCARFQHYKPVEKIDRGAESPDKSWFGIAKSNAHYYGYDKRMLDALYRIAGDNEW